MSDREEIIRSVQEGLDAIVYWKEAPDDRLAALHAVMVAARLIIRTREPIEAIQAMLVERLEGFSKA
ncbi:hypothetical protein [Roseomonas sp. BN140053]|uniref:hypothetical protein n=1 Tax=Roseomonas sp. BN140053 TaxID=3391898 RepID=UPI0039ED2582